MENAYEKIKETLLHFKMKEDITIIMWLCLVNRYIHMDSSFFSLPFVFSHVAFCDKIVPQKFGWHTLNFDISIDSFLRGILAQI